MLYVLRTNRWVKRGVSLIPTKYGIAFGIGFLNQGGALLHVYTDGSVLLTHGGMEMGQGLHTKMVQVHTLYCNVLYILVHVCVHVALHDTQHNYRVYTVWQERRTF